MKNCPEILNPRRVEREGTSRPQRMMNSLKPSYVPVNEHGPANWMVFAKRYAKYLKYFDLTDTEAGNWEAFFENDPSALLATAAVQRVEFYKQNLHAYLSFLLKNDNSGKGADLKKNFGNLFNCVGTLAWQLEVLKNALPPEIGLRDVLKNLIHSQLAGPFARLIGYYKFASAPGSDGNGGTLIDTSQPPLWDILGTDILPFEDSLAQNFSVDWTDGGRWGIYSGAITADSSIFGGVIADTVFLKLNYAAAHNLFTDSLDQFLKVYARVVSEAKKSLKKSLEEWDKHEPHYTLFLSFLRLLEYARDHANTLTARHLDFYYKEILQLKERPAEPNHAHLIFDLAKHRKNHLLKAGTLFKAGKDSEGKPVVFKLDEDFVANRANLAELRALHLDDHLRSYPTANSDDGNGAELTSPDGQWDAFVRLKNPTSGNLAKVGFAIASHYLYLREGQRRIRLTLKVKDFPKKEMSIVALCNAFQFYLTGEKGWVEAPLDTANIAAGGLKQLIEIPLLLDGGQPPIVPLSAKVHGTDLPAGLPTLKAVLKQDATNATALKNLQDMTFTVQGSRLSVAVGYDGFKQGSEPNALGIKNLQVSTKFGAVKPEKPFMPFGPVPETGDSLILGSDEAFQKENARLQFQVTWKNLPVWRGDMDFDWVNEFTPRVNVDWLKNGSWQTAGLGGSEGVQIISESMFPLQAFSVPESPVQVKEAAVSEVHFEDRPYSLDSRSGFLRLQLLGDFGHKLYQLTLPRYLLRVGQEPETLIPVKDEENGAKPTKYPQHRGHLRDAVYKKDEETGRYVPRNNFQFTEQFVEHFSKAMPVEPYTPEIESITLSYRAEHGLKNKAAKCYHLTPFGYKPVANTTATSLPLLPKHEYEGELLIGVKDLQPPQNLSLLFQMAEGSADPTVKKPDKHVEWSYLKNNVWEPFGDLEISDQTNQLTRSGVVRFSVPRGATTTDSCMLPNGHHWLRMAVKDTPEAICKIINISAQAARVTFENQGNATDFLDQQTKAGTIGKMVVPDSAVKKLEQPYATFGGRPKEASDHFYTRVSERLRHKQRALTAWDYEHLVLEAFPQIFKVKCLNHTHFEPGENGDKKIYNELAPGHVTVVALPKVQNRNAVNPLRPYTNLGDLELIEEFLKKHVSCFAKLHVHNPVYETVKVKFSVKFHTGVDEAFFTEQLQKTIVRFLAPWAFGDSKEVKFGGKVYKSALIDLVEEQSYVDYVTDFQLFHGNSGIDREEVQASTAIAVLVAAPEADHDVTAI